MAITINNHFHLDTDNPPTAEYPIKMGTLDNTPLIAIATERALTGKLHIHRLVSGSDPIQFVADRFATILTLAEMLTLKALIGKNVYYTPIYHDPANHAATTSAIVFMVPQGGITNIDPMGVYWTMQIDIVDNQAVP